MNLPDVKHDDDDYGAPADVSRDERSLQEMFAEMNGLDDLVVRATMLIPAVRAIGNDRDALDMEIALQRLALLRSLPHFDESTPDHQRAIHDVLFEWAWSSRRVANYKPPPP